MKKLITCLLALPLLLVSCEENEIETSPTEAINTFKLDESSFIKIDPITNLNSKGSNEKESIVDIVATLNEALMEYDIQLEKMELLGAEGEGKTIVFSDVGNKQMNSDFIPDDPRNFFPGTQQYYWVDGTELGTSSGMSDGATLNAIDNAFSTWNSVSCSEGLDIINYGVTTPEDIYNDVGVVQRALGFGGAGWRISGSVLFGGILPEGFFERLRPGGGENTLGVTFTYIWFNQDGPTVFL